MSDGHGTTDTGELAPDAPEDFPDGARRALVVLLTNRFITRTRNRAVWDILRGYEEEIRGRLADLYLTLEIDHDHGVAFKRQIMEEDTPRILRKDRPLSRDASFLLIFLCQECAHADPQDELVVVTRAQIDEFLSAYRQDDDGDQAKFDRRVTAAIRQLQDLRLLNQDPDADYLYTISPVVVPLVGVDELTRLEAAYRLGAGATANDGNGTENSAQLLDEES
ncbi:MULTISPECIES: DUF4194 domain-containing protein [Microbacterium]|jgi:hypothetical protein|uniref:DUF4194 domain-containing protein n=1 Tax=Microbacterium TaxID=33882 RepID=UPI000959F15F|nr:MULTISPECIES: DUF4194 domain-containing protein [Microbacterium]EED6225481.1 DUF4194 domain-containing protein [Salmonella enterica subsp. enterica serovar Haifa]MAB77734.1 hypothetical protein [Planctomycetota bacterium]MBN9153913.1 DUF4194 domain-containing protein [Microbacterium sp.]MBN9170883.1 DUF4194 domain-containing protein [Microbacterium sp.]OJV94279.1 MAG: hypothetical protein BGO47_11150 [Microbacterium sp. 67-17]|tara:strand:+ start:5195 stop:5860 length:666 start_codon:yes stop_codon:yes gene_type:complete